VVGEFALDWGRHKNEIFSAKQSWSPCSTRILVVKHHSSLCMRAEGLTTASDEKKLVEQLQSVQQRTDKLPQKSRKRGPVFHMFVATRAFNAAFGVDNRRIRAGAGCEVSVRVGKSLSSPHRLRWLPRTRRAFSSTRRRE
jgi:hypothetical protein